MVTALLFLVRFGCFSNTIQRRVFVNISQLDYLPKSALETKHNPYHAPLTGPSYATQNPIIATVSNLDPNEAASGDKDKLYLVVMFYNLLDADWRASHFTFSKEKWDERMREISDCIKQIWTNSMVATVHYIYHNVTMMNPYLDRLDLPHREKLFVHEANVTTVGGFMRFASDNLQGCVAMFLNFDGFLGEGFDKIDIPFMRKNNVAFALTGQWVACTGGGSCYDGDIYQ